MTAVSAATVLAYAYVLIPVGLLAALFCKRLAPSKVSWLPIVLFFGLLTSSVPSLNRIATAVHVDAPALGLFLTGCYGVLWAVQANPGTNGRWIAMAGVFAGLSGSCKITLVAGIVALALFTLWALGWKRAAGFILSAALAGGTAYAWIIMRDGWSAVALNFQVLGKFPWAKHLVITTSIYPALPDTSRQLSEKIMTSLILSRAYLQDYGVVILGTMALTRRLTGPAVQKGSLSPGQIVWFFLFIAVMMMPASIASAAKYGGAVNSKGLFTLPLTLAAIFALWATVQRANQSGNFAVCVGLTGTIYIVALSTNGELKLLHFGKSIMEESYATVRTHPSQCYFPYDPLAHLLAGDQFRPNIDVIYTYAVGGSPVDKAAFESSMSRGMEYLIYPSRTKFWGLSELRRLLPAQNVTASDLHLQQHEVWGR